MTELPNLKAEDGTLNTVPADWYDRMMAGVKPSAHKVLPLPSREQVAALLAAAGGRERVLELFKQREELIRLEKTDPYRYGMVLQPWRDADALLNGQWKRTDLGQGGTPSPLPSQNYTNAARGAGSPPGEGTQESGTCTVLAVFGGNRAAKTEYGAHKGVRILVEQPEKIVLWLHESEPTSVDIQQVAVHKYLPVEWRNVKKGQVTNVSYSRKNGFSDNKFVLPNGSVGKFGSYKQDIADYEGFEYDLIVADENFPLAWMKTLLIRLATRAGKMVWSFTPIHGITAAGKEIVEGAVTLASRAVDPDLLDREKVYVEDCPKGHMPYVQRSVFNDTRIIYFHSELNPYGNYPSLKKLLTSFDVEDRKRRAYGYARNTIMTLFPLFGAVHIIEATEAGRANCPLHGAGCRLQVGEGGELATCNLQPATDAEGESRTRTRTMDEGTDCTCYGLPEMTRYHIGDPAGARNMFQVWWGVDSHGRNYIYREWPDVARYGDWAEPAEDNKKRDGMMGPAQPTLGYGVLDYKRQILSDEGNEWEAGRGWTLDGERIEERYMDPRSGAAQAVTEDKGGSSLMDRFREEQIDERGILAGPAMDFLPAKGLREDEGIQAINDLLSYDRKQPVTSLVNEPRLFVTRNCASTIWALKNYTGHDGERAACKDPVDVLRYGATADLKWLEPGRARSLGGGAY